QATLGQVPGEDPEAVAAHLGGAPVVVAVAHDPLGRGAGGGARPAAVRCRGGLASAPGGPGTWPACQRLGPHRAQHPVGADAGPAVAQPRGQARRKPPVASWINQDDEVILGAVPLREPHSPMLVSRPVAPVRPAAGRTAFPSQLDTLPAVSRLRTPRRMWSGSDEPGRGTAATRGGCRARGGSHEQPEQRHAPPPTVTTADPAPAPGRGGASSP